jgi:hypothetical protein
MSIDHDVPEPSPQTVLNFACPKSGYAFSTIGMLIASRFDEVTVERSSRRRRFPMKIYLLMLLVGAIAAMSYLDLRRESPQRKSEQRTPSARSIA